MKKAIADELERQMPEYDDIPVNDGRQLFNGLDQQDLERQFEEYKKLSPQELEKIRLRMQREDSIASLRIRNRILFGEDE